MKWEKNLSEKWLRNYDFLPNYLTSTIYNHVSEVSYTLFKKNKMLYNIKPCRIL